MAQRQQICPCCVQFIDKTSDILDQDLPTEIKFDDDLPNGPIVEGAIGTTQWLGVNGRPSAFTVTVPPGSTWGSIQDVLVARLQHDFDTGQAPHGAWIFGEEKSATGDGAAHSLFPCWGAPPQSGSTRQPLAAGEYDTGGRWHHVMSATGGEGCSANTETAYAYIGGVEAKVLSYKGGIVLAHDLAEEGSCIITVTTTKHTQHDHMAPCTSGTSSPPEWDHIDTRSQIPVTSQPRQVVVWSAPGYGETTHSPQPQQAAYASGGGGAGGAAEQLVKFSDLRNQGIISDAEFETAKQKILMSLSA